MTLRTRGLWIAGLVALSLFLAVPSFYTPAERESSPWIPDNGIALGLDLQGGIHWLLRIDTRTAVQQELERTRSTLLQALKDRKVEAPEIQILEAEALEVQGTGATLEAVRELVAGDFSSLEVAADDGALRLRLTETWNRAVVERGVRQAQEVLRKRIDGLGVTEPVIAPQGEGRILVQLPGEVDPINARQILEKTTFLEFKRVLDAAPS
ncbi:MAG: hypothetical protein V3T14_02630, partial [Myxococcota bacterium]